MNESKFILTDLLRESISLQVIKNSHYVTWDGYNKYYFTDREDAVNFAKYWGEETFWHGNIVQSNHRSLHSGYHERAERQHWIQYNLK